MRSSTTHLTILLKTKEDNHIKEFFFGGGDGSFHHGLNAWLNFQKRNTDEVQFGAIGLGSSNDLHKPFGTVIDKIPIRIYPVPYKQDVGRVVIIENEQELTKYFVINASLGITAYGNYLFNHPDPILRFTKSRWTNFAINYAALKSILLYKNIMVEVDSGEGYKPMKLSTVNIIKSVHIAGGLFFDQDIKPNDGFLGVNTCENMNKLELMHVFADLSKGKFLGKPKRDSQVAKAIRFRSASIIPLELDGEIYFGNEFIFDLLPQHINLLR